MKENNIFLLLNIERVVDIHRFSNNIYFKELVLLYFFQFCNRQIFLHSEALLNSVKKSFIHFLVFSTSSTNSHWKNPKCKICDKSFTQFSTFVHHQITHIGEKPYTFLQCQKLFFRLPISTVLQEKILLFAIIVKNHSYN